MKVSLITTVYNEEDSIEELIESVVNQTRVPDEFVIVDGWSSDLTYFKIRDYARKYDWIKLVQADVNISEGRNLAIEKASHENIITTDGGCVLKEDFIEKMSEKLENNDCVAGNFKSREQGHFEHVLGKLLVDHLERDQEKGRTTPSSRSMGIKKKVWSEVGGYPEDLYTGEDSEFCRRVKEKGYEFEFVKEAKVYWRMRSSLKAVAKQFFSYGKGDGQAKNTIKHPARIAGLPKPLLLNMVHIWTLVCLLLGFWNNFYFLFFVSFMFVPSIYYFGETAQLTKENPLSFFTAQIIILTKNWSYFFGFWRGALQ